METSRHSVWSIPVLLVSLVLVVLAPSGQSLWSDEAHSWRFLSAPTFGECMTLIATDSGSQAQMPGYFAAGWVAGRLAGFSEWGLRAQNILWGAVGVVALFFIGRIFQAPLLPLLLAVNPFAWYYLDEARPYAMQIGGACLLCWALARAMTCKSFGKVTAALWLAGAWTVASASMLGVFPLGVATLATAWVCFRRRIPFTRGAVGILLVCHVALIALGGYYAWTLIRGAEGAKLWVLGVSNVGFAFYELLGFSGMGPGRVELREAAWTGKSAALALLASHAAGLTATALFLGAAGLAALWMRSGASRRFALLCLVVLGGGFVAVCSAAFVAGFPFWGRHLAPLLPWIIVPLTLGVVHSRLPAVLRGAILAGLVLCWFAADLNIRFAERHSKDNYRAAAHFAKEALAEGSTVWWVADAVSATYYGLPLSLEEKSGVATLFFRPTAEDLVQRPAPDLIVFARPAQMDELGSMRQFLSEKGYSKRPERWTAFTVWERGTAN